MKFACVRATIIMYVIAKNLGALNCIDSTANSTCLAAGTHTGTICDLIANHPSPITRGNPDGPPLPATCQAFIGTIGSKDTQFRGNDSGSSVDMNSVFTIELCTGSRIQNISKLIAGVCLKATVVVVNPSWISVFNGCYIVNINGITSGRRAVSFGDGSPRIAPTSISRGVVSFIFYMKNVPRPDSERQ